MSDETDNAAAPVDATAPETPEPPHTVATVPKRLWNDHMITIHDPERLREAWQFAQQTNQSVEFATEFMAMLALIAGFAKDADMLGYDLRGRIRYDGCRHSFAWYTEAAGPIPATPTRDHVPFMNGALIYHGRGSGETFSTTLGDTRPWVNHT